MLAYRRADVRDLNEAAPHAHAPSRTPRPGRGEARTSASSASATASSAATTTHASASATAPAPPSSTLDDDDAQPPRPTPARVRRLPFGYAAEHLDHGYALTGHAAQGATVERAFVLLRRPGALQEWGYVACSRARTETRLYLAFPTHEPDLLAADRQPDHVPERTARALALPTADRLAVEQIDPATARLHAARGTQLEQARARAERRLADAEKQLQQLGWRGRRRRGSRARTEIALQRTALRLAREKVAAHALAVDAPVRPLEGDERAHTHELARRTPARPQPARTRPPDRTRPRTRDRVVRRARPRHRRFVNAHP